MIARRTLGVLVFGSLLFGCHACSGLGPTAEHPRAEATIRYLSLGDSFTAGTGSGPEASFPSRLVALWRGHGRTVVHENPAVNGFTTRDVIARELPRLASFHPTYVTLAIGANDIVRDTPEATYRENVRTIVDAVLSSGVAPANLVALPQPRWPRSPTGRRFGELATLMDAVQRFDAILRAEVEARGGRWADLGSLLESQSLAAAWAPDGLHPDAPSYEAWAVFLEGAAPPR